MPPAARISDMHVCPLVTPGTPPVPHVGGPVLVGAPTVITAFMPQARVGDTCTCVGPPDAIAAGSPTVLVCGMPAARMGDATIHGGTVASGAPNVLIGVSGAGGAGGGGPAVLGPVQIGEATSGDGPPPVAPPPDRPFKRRLGGDDNVDVMFFEATGQTSSEDGRRSAGGEAKTGLLQMEHYGHKGWFGGGHELESMTFEGEVYGSIGRTGLGVQADGSARFKREGGTLAFGPDENNPFARVDGHYEVLGGETKNRLLIGSDGKEAGLEVGAFAEGALLSGEAKGEVGFKIPFTNWTIALSSKVDGAVGDGAIGGNVHAKRDADGIYRAGAKGYLGGGLEGAVHAGRDTSTGRFHFGGKGGIKAIFGGKLDFDLSIGPAYTDRDRIH